MDKKQILFRVGAETDKRMQALADKYGMTVSGLLVSLVNDRWLAENKLSETSDQPLPVMGKQKRKRHKPKN